MKPYVAILALVVGLCAHAKEVVLVSGFDPFGGARTNASWIVAEALAARFQNDPNIEVHTCLLPTTYRGAYPKLKECYDRLPSAPVLVLSLGEGPCKLNLETQVYNLDNNPGRLMGSSAPDNEGVRRTRRTIVAGAPFSVGLRINAAEAYCSLTPAERTETEISSTPGNFVCNNAAFQFTWNHPEVPFTFAHVTGQNCRNRLGKIEQNIAELTTIIHQQVTAANQLPRSQMPHPSNTQRMPISRDAINEQRSEASGCEADFWNC